MKTFVAIAEKSMSGKLAEKRAQLAQLKREREVRKLRVQPREERIGRLVVRSCLTCQDELLATRESPASIIDTSGGSPVEISSGRHISIAGIRFPFNL